MLAVVFGVVTLPKVTLSGVWNGKDGSHWKGRELAFDVWSPTLEARLEREQRISGQYRTARVANRTRSAGAAGYAAMNLGIFVYVCYFARAVLGRVPLDGPLTARFPLGLGCAAVAATGAVALLERTGLSPTAVAIAAAVVCGAAFVGVLPLTSGATRVAVDRASELSLGWVRSRVR